jgi:hypothetical protein
MGIHNTTEQLNKKNSKQLDKIISQIRIVCQNKQNTSSLDAMLFGATGLVESTVSNKTKYNMKGYTEMLKHDNGFLESWELIKIERLSFARMSPELRFMYGLGVNALAVVNINRMMDEMKNQQKDQATINQIFAEPAKEPVKANIPPVNIPQAINPQANNSRGSLVFNGKL